MSEWITPRVDKTGKIYINDKELVTKEYVINLINSINVQPSFDLLTADIQPHIVLNGVYPRFLDGNYFKIKQKYTLYAGIDYQHFILSDRDVWVKENQDGSCSVVIYTISLGINKVLSGKIQMQNPMWLILKYKRNPNHIVPNINHVSDFIDVEACLGTGETRFGIYGFPDHPNVKYLQ